MIRRLSVRKRFAAAVALLVAGLLLSPLLVANRLRRRRDIERILILELWGIGDLVLVTGALRGLRARFPRARLSLLGKGYARPLLLESGLVDEVIVYDFPWTAFRGKYAFRRYVSLDFARTLWTLRRRRFDVVLNARSDARSNVLLAVIGAARSISLSCGVGDVLVDEPVSSPAADAHRWDDWRAVTERLVGEGGADHPPALSIGEEEIDRARAVFRLPARGHRPIIGIHPGASAAVRRWGDDRFARVADMLVERLDAHIIVFAEPDGTGVTLPARCSTTTVRGALRELMSVQAACDLLICNESGPMHIAAALGTAVVAVFGPGRAEWFGPLGSKSRLVQMDDVHCRPCFDSCRYAQPWCLTGIDENAVVEAALQLLQGPGGRERRLLDAMIAV